VPYEVPESWQWVKLKDLCIFLSRGKSPVYSETDKRYPVFAQKCNLKGGGISLKEARFLEPSTISKWKDVYKLQDGDILINSTGTGTVCRTRLFKSEYLCDYPFVVPDSHVSVIRTYEQISSEYAYLVLSSKFSQDYMMDNLAGSTNQKELYISVLENLLFPLPPFGEQMRIVKCVNKIYTQLEQISSEL
jgi:type I restriction enzyme S subunit